MKVSYYLWWSPSALWYLVCFSKTKTGLEIVRIISTLVHFTFTLHSYTFLYLFHFDEKNVFLNLLSFS